MPADTLKDMLHATPFRAFEIQLVSGKRIRVGHPEMLALSPGGRSAVVWEGDGIKAILDVLTIEALLPTGSNRRRN